MEAQRPNRPSSTIRSITYSNSYDIENKVWLPNSIEIDSWVLLQTRNQKKEGNEFINSHKARVKEFKVADNGKIKEVYVQHAYLHSQLRVQSSSHRLPLHRPNCKYLNSHFSYVYHLSDA